MGHDSGLRVEERIAGLSASQRRFLAARLSAATATRPDVAPRRPEADPAADRLVAFIVADGSTGGGQPPLPAAAEVRRFLRQQVPEHMVPQRFVALEALPLNANGKIDRNALGELLLAPPEAGDSGARPQTEAEKLIAGIWREVLDTEVVSVGDNFFDVGGHSLLLLRLQARLCECFGTELSVIDLFRYTTIRSQARFLRPLPAQAPTATEDPRLDASAGVREPLPGDSTEIAVVGLAGRFPGASNVEELWRNLAAGVESIATFSDAQLAAAGMDPALLDDPRLIRSGGVLENIERFDAAFFAMNPREAEITDPQHRLFLEQAWVALEDAGYDPAAFPGRIGVYAGVGFNTYWNRVRSSTRGRSMMGRFQASTANDKDFVPTLVAYKLDLKGPAVSVQTACSTSLVAIHQACRSLSDGECEMALAGGATVAVPQAMAFLHEEGGILSPDGHCRAFDAAARGMVPGSGVGIVVLKRLADAVADGDSIRAVIKARRSTTTARPRSATPPPASRGRQRSSDRPWRTPASPPQTSAWSRPTAPVPSWEIRSRSPPCARRSVLRRREATAPWAR